MRATRAEAAGRPDPRPESSAAEAAYARMVRGANLGPQGLRFDTLHPCGLEVDVKAVTTASPRWSYVDVGTRAPVAHVVVMRRRSPTRWVVVGAVERGSSAIVRGVPPRSLSTERCHYVLREDLRDHDEVITCGCIWTAFPPPGSPIGAARLCPSCGDRHPVGTTCAAGWAPWDDWADIGGGYGAPGEVIQSRPVSVRHLAED